MHHHHHSVTHENQTKTLWVIILTVITMAAEITYGYWSNSMALLADGYHMGTHALALGLTYGAYVLINHCTGSEKFPYGTQKIGTLAAYTSAIFLGLTGIWIVFEAVLRLFNPRLIEFNQAIIVAVIGMVVNVVCILIMEYKKSHQSADITAPDYNFKAAYYHILADALTSILAIIALVIGKYTGFVCLDALIGIAGGMLIIKWAVGLLKHTVTVLIDMKTS